MRLVEYRILMPLTLDEFKKGQRWSATEVMRLSTGGGVGTEIIKNENFNVPEHTMRNYTSFLPEIESDCKKQIRKKRPKRINSMRSLTRSGDQTQSASRQNLMI